ncbi:hypothetical protein HQ584_11500 [Patescibacteria group bacterium]|nr:hypothetical protein [Patescibacteria group bacterium]
MKNPFENLPIKEPVAGESDVEAVKANTKKNPETERTKEFLQLINAAKKKAQDIINKARGMTGSDRTRTEQEAYKIYAALYKLGIELPKTIINTIGIQIKKGTEGKEGIKGFVSKKSAEIFLKDVVGKTENIEEAMAA